jgi:uncharacterized protein YqgQ
MLIMNVDTEIKMNFTNETQQVINAMCMISNDGLILAGSSSQKNMKYPNDIDLHQIVDVNYKTRALAIRELVHYFQKMIEKLKELPNVFITDIKFGTVSDYNILENDIEIHNNKIINYDSKKCINKINELYDNKIITSEEYKDAKKVIVKDAPTLKQYFEMKDTLKFSTVRATVSDIRNGFIVFRHRKFLLNKLILTGIVKVDVVAYINGKYTELSNIYEFKNNNKMLSPIGTNLDDSLKEDIMYNNATKNYFKMAKRIFSFDLNMGVTNEKLIRLFNSQLGIIYNVLSDIKVLALLLESTGKLSYKKISTEINMFKLRLAHIYSVHEFLKEHESITEIIDKLSKIPSVVKRGEYFNELSVLMKKFEAILNKSTKKVLNQMHLLPLPEKYRL